MKTLNKRRINREHITCVRPSHDGQRTEGVWMISSCPEDMKNSEANRRCQNSNGSDLYETIPVTDKLGLTYKNVHCGVCHRVSTVDMTLWNIQAHCNEQITSLLQERIDNNDPFVDVVQLLSENCGLAFSSPGHTGPVGNRSCVQHGNVDECLQGVPSNVLDICQEYTAYILDRDDDDQSDSTLEGHRNPHCFYCSHGYPYNVMNCHLPIPIVGVSHGQIPTPPRGLPIIPISALVNFDRDGFVSVSVDETVLTQQVIQCPEGAVFDPFSEICRALSCPAGSHLVGDICVPSAESTGCSMSELILGLTAVVNKSAYYPSGEDSLLQKEVEMCLMDLLQIKIMETMTSQWTQPRTSSVEDIAEKDSIVRFDFHIEYYTDSIVALNEVFSYIFLQSKNDNDYLCGIIAATVSQVCVSLNECSTTEIESEFIFVTISNASFIFANDTDQVYHILQPRIFITYERSSTADVDFSKIQNVITCDDPLFCTLVTLKESEFQVINDTLGVILHKPSGRVFERNEYQITPDGSIQVCSFFVTSGITNFTDVVSFVAYSKPQVIVTIIGYIFSILGEIATFVTYCVFRTTRNRTSYAIMNLVVALFLGQLLLLVGGGRTEPKPLCTTIAILLHYFFLSTFSWSTVLSYDLYLIFGADTAPVRVDANRKILIIQMTYAWCCPFVIILPCVIVHFCNCTNLDFQYGSSMSCWINNEYANLLVFGLPILVALLFNIYFFCRTVWGIHLSKRETANRAPAEKARKKKYQELMIYAKVIQ